MDVTVFLYRKSLSEVVCGMLWEQNAKRAHASDNFRPYCYVMTHTRKIIGLRQWRVFSQLTWLLRTIPFTHSGRSIDGDEEYVTGECLWRQNYQLVTTVSIWIHIIECYMIMEYSRTLQNTQTKRCISTLCVRDAIGISAFSQILPRWFRFIISLSTSTILRETDSRIS